MMGGMRDGSGPEWVIREDAGQPVLLALFLRQAIGLRSPDELPHLRGVPPRPVPDRPDDLQALLERPWRAHWAMTVQPQRSEEGAVGEERVRPWRAWVAPDNSKKQHKTITQ